MFAPVRKLFAAASVALLVSGSGCLHSWGTLKDQVRGSSADSLPDTQSIAKKVDSELTAKPAAQLAYTMGEQLEKAGKDNEAIPYYEKARTSDPQFQYKCARRLAVLYDRLGESSKSQTEFQSLLVSKPRDADLINDYGYSLYTRGQWSEAATQFRKALDLNKNHKRAAVNLGLALGQQGLTDESLEAFHRVVSPMEAKANLAFVLASQGKKEAAKAMYLAALDGEPTLKSAQLGLAALEKNETPESPLKVDPNVVPVKSEPLAKPTPPMPAAVGPIK